MFLILGRFELNRKGAGGQDALGQTHSVMSVPVCMQQSHLPYKSVRLMWHFSLIRHHCYPGNFCGLSPPHVKLDLMSSFWKVRGKSTSCLPLFPFTAHLLGLFLVYSVVQTLEGLFTKEIYQVAFFHKCNSRKCLPLLFKNWDEIRQFFAAIRGYVNGHRKQRGSQGKKGRVIPWHLKHYSVFIQIFLANGDFFFLYVSWCVVSVVEAASVDVSPRKKIPIDIEYIPGAAG